jgi:stage II sporulation protein R
MGVFYMSIGLLIKRAAALTLIFVCCIFTACGGHTITEKHKLIRIHIRADSDGEGDQEVKYAVRDRIAAFLEASLEGVTDFGTAYEIIGGLLEEVERETDAVLAGNGFTYRSDAALVNEFFPARGYENIVVESGYYDALILTLGSGGGENWWCVIYPPLCYLEAHADGDGAFKYESYIAEIFKKYFGKKRG